MKRIFAVITLASALAAAIALTLAAPKPAHAQMFCHDEMICTPVGGCRWVTVCR